MKKIYQIVIKGENSNKIEVVDYATFESYIDALNDFKKCKYINILTTNIYFE